VQIAKYKVPTDYSRVTVMFIILFTWYRPTYGRLTRPRGPFITIISLYNYFRLHIIVFIVFVYDQL